MLSSFFFVCNRVLVTWEAFSLTARKAGYTPRPSLHRPTLLPVGKVSWLQIVTNWKCFYM